MTERLDMTAPGSGWPVSERASNRSPLVLLHALGEQAASWDEVRPALDQLYRVLALDLRGHGNSDWPGEYSFRTDVSRCAGRA